MRRRTIIAVVSLVLCLLPAATALADAYHLYPGGYDPIFVSSLSYVLSGGDSYYQQNIMSAGANQWNGISSNVYVWLYASGARMSIYKSSTPLDSVYGEMIPYKRNILGLIVVASLTDVWWCTDCKGFDNTMTLDGFTDAQKKATFSHEIGHALSLDHTMDLATREVMDQGRFKALSPTSVDRGHLTLKWGY